MKLATNFIRYMNKIQQTRKTLFLIFGSIFIVIVGSMGAYISVQYFLQAQEEGPLLTDIMPSEYEDVASGSSQPEVTFATVTPDPIASASPTITLAYVPPTAQPTLEPTLVVALNTPTSSPEAFYIDPTAEPTTLALNTPTATPTKIPSQLPLTSSVPMWAAGAAGAMILLVAAGFVL